jgi:hypothetical protein
MQQVEAKAPPIYPKISFDRNVVPLTLPDILRDNVKSTQGIFANLLDDDALCFMNQFASWRVW